MYDICLSRVPNWVFLLGILCIALCALPSATVVQGVGEVVALVAHCAGWVCAVPGCDNGGQRRKKPRLLNRFECKVLDKPYPSSGIMCPHHTPCKVNGCRLEGSISVTPHHCAHYLIPFTNTFHYIKNRLSHVHCVCPHHARICPKPNPRQRLHLINDVKDLLEGLSFVRGNPSLRRCVREADK